MGTPADRTVPRSPRSQPRGGERASCFSPGAVSATAVRTPAAITAFLVELGNRAAVFQIQRTINDFRGEALLAILPGVALHQLRETIGIAESALRVVAACVVIAGLLGMLTAILTSLNERRREMAISARWGRTPDSCSCSS